MREEQRARLHHLADSINDTARMARTSLSLVLLVALYLGLTLVASTDENLLLNGQVTLPQAGVGISVEQSYIFAPPIFFYLHIQLLFLLSVLARKIHTFETALKEEFPDALPAHAQNKTEAERGECWEWLSAFAFVQLFRQTPGMPRVLKLGAGTLAWFGIETVPLALLFVIDISFVRYQSAGISWSHHCIFILDLVSIGIFNWFVLPGQDRRQWKNSHRSSILRFDWWISGRSTVILGWLWISVRGTVAVGMVFLLISAAHPPQFDPRRIEKDRRSIWGERDRNFWQAIWSDRENPLDAGSCYWWRLGCRYLDVRNKWLLGAQPEDLVGSISDGITPKTVGDIRRFHLGSPDLARRRLRFARFGSVYLQSVDLREAELQGADLGGAQLQEADLGGAQLQEADLWEAQLQGADLRGVQLQGADLGLAKLQGTYLWEAQLQGADLQGAQLQGAYLWKAQLQGTNLWEAQLQGAHLWEAQLRGADLTRAELQGSWGEPASWYLAWMPYVSVDFPGSSEQYLEELLSDEIKDIKLAWQQDVTLEQHLKQSLSGDSDREVFDGAKPDDTDLVVHQRTDATWPEAPDVHSDSYWVAWAEWASEFACENEYTARSILQRWSSSIIFSGPLVYLNAPDSDFLSFMRKEDIYDRARNNVREALFNARREPKCAGLRDLSENEWKKFVGG